MSYYPPEQRRRAFPQNPRRGQVPPPYRPNFGPHSEINRPENPYLYNQQHQQGHQQHQQGYPQPPQGYPQQHQGYQQQPQQGPRRRLPDMNRMMDHAGKVSEGINIVRQIGALFNLYR
ncbi:hypothetical protein [Ureibacillus aquaedulcis]|uniref:YppG-like protein n=1 Tax=Ureibacillus aquaedulcis TaxID=3058421 RepID=A0ABT8GTN6_9BACL|nr:hypothetical protein [Ureibacillus sp. BA0131]MDN4494752.1 hypothetical protein [Ureibacillus sp. BA0131]